MIRDDEGPSIRREEMKEVETVKVDMKSLQAAVLKYRKIVDEVESGASKSNMVHTVMKLGIFLEQAVGRKLFDEIEDAKFD